MQKRPVSGGPQEKLSPACPTLAGLCSRTEAASACCLAASAYPATLNNTLLSFTYLQSTAPAANPSHSLPVEGGQLAVFGWPRHSGVHTWEVKPEVLANTVRHVCSQTCAVIGDCYKGLGGEVRTVGRQWQHDSRSSQGKLTLTWGTMTT